MPPVIAIAVTFAIKAVVANLVLQFVLSLVVSMILNAIFAKPKPKAPQQQPYANYARDRTLSIRQPVSPRRVVYGEVKMGGTMVFMHTTNSDTRLHIIQTVAGHEVEAIGDVYLNDEVMPALDADGWVMTGKYANLVRIRKHLGAADQTADSVLTTEASDKWTANHRLRGVAYLYITLVGNSDAFANGLPNFSCLVQGKKDVYDPRASPPTAGYSNNAALCMANYLTDTKYGLGEDYAAAIGETDLIVAANVCDESVSLVGGGTESRYTCNGSFDSNEKPEETIPEMLTAMDGKVVFVGGQWIILSGAYITPTVTLTEKDAHDNIQVTPRISRRELFNAVKGVYSSPQNNWQPADFHAVTNSTYETNDNGERIWRDITLPYTTSPSTAQRIAKAQLERGRQQIVVSFHAKLIGLQLRAGDTVMLTLTRFGWTSKVFEVVGWEFELYDDAEGENALGVNLTLRETASTIWSWTPGTDEVTVDAAPDTNLPNPFIVGAPSGLVLSSGDDHLLLLTEGSVISRIHVSWTEATDLYTSFYELAYKKSTDTEWTALAQANTSPAYAQPVEDGTDYDVRVRAVNRLGVRSTWSTVVNHTVVGKTAPPSRPDSFTVSRLADGTRRYGMIHAVVPADVRAGGGYRLRYYVGTTSDWSAMTSLHAGLLTAFPFENNELAAGTYTWAIKSVDSSGNESTEAVFIYGEIGDPRLKNVLLAQVEQESGWPGTKTDCFVYNGALIPNDAGNMNSLPATMNDLAADILHIVANADPITYTTLQMDLGADVSFTPLVSVTGSGNATITMQVGTTADGAAVGAFVSLAQVAGKRYLKIKVIFAGADSPPAAVLTGMTTLVDSETTIEEYEDVNTATESDTWFDNTSTGLGTGHFRIGSRAGDLAVISSARIVALQNVGAGWSWELLSKTQTVNGQVAAEFKVYNSSNALANAVLDIELKGPKS